jgi:hypothetical protein
LVHSASSGEGRNSQGRGYNRLDKAAVPNKPRKTAFTFTFTLPPDDGKLASLEHVEV